LLNGSAYRMRSVKIPVALFRRGVSKVSFFHATDSEHTSRLFPELAVVYCQ
jgi:hypothetical protein